MRDLKKIDTIVIHCSATTEGRDLDINDIDKMHKERGFKKQSQSGYYCGYNYIVQIDGTIENGRYLTEHPAGVKGENHHTVHICYIGGLDRMGKAKDTRTEMQKDSIKRIIIKLWEENNLPNIKYIKGHRDFSPDLNKDGKITPNEYMKECPCFQVSKEYSICNNQLLIEG